MDQKGKLWVRPILVKVQIFQRFFKHCFFFTEIPPPPQKMSLASLLIWSARLWKILTWQWQMPYWWKLPWLFNFIKFVTWCKNVGILQRASKGIDRKPLIRSQKISFFGLISSVFQTTLKTVTYGMHYFALHHWLKFYTNFTTFGLFHRFWNWRSKLKFFKNLLIPWGSSV